MNRNIFLVVCWLFLSVFTGCATKLPTDIQRQPSVAIAGHDTTYLGRLFEEAAAEHPGTSGFALIRKGRPAFTERIAMADLAEKTLDLQYYIWEADATGRVLALRLCEAANRGVRVRILVDDNNLTGKDSVIAALDAHPNIEIRIFNPFAHRGSRLFGYLTDFRRLNHRMHNKVIIADNAIAIVGGRNIGNHYFGVHTEANFRDLDIAAAGPVVRDLSAVFDYFWNGQWSYSISAIADRAYTGEDLEKTVSEFKRLIREKEYPYPLDNDVERLKARIDILRDNIVWARGQVVWDDPELLTTGGEGAKVIQKKLYRKVETLQSELLIESAYFVAAERGVQEARKLQDRGVKVRVLTNSLATNDVLAAHAGYAKYRKELLKAGVDIYELRVDSVSPTVMDRKIFAGGKSKAALHTKAIVFDRDSIFVGSYNLDPRSANINTEMGLYVEDRELAAQLADYMDEGVQPENAYRVTLDKDGDLTWQVQKDGLSAIITNEPDTTFWQRFMSGFIKVLPFEQQL